MPYPSTTWRLLITPPAPGPWNMAVDEAILEGIGAGDSRPTLRLYAWEPPCLSLGYAQPFGDVDLPRLQAHSWLLVRRPTGGRAILHTDELTYAVIAPPDDPRLAGSVLESYRRLSQALLAALQAMHIPASAHSLPSLPAGADPKGPVCFEVPSNYEITVDNRKLIGSAQARRKGGVLQHGSLPLYGDLGRITEALCYENEAARQKAAQRVRERACTCEDVFGQPIPWDTAAQKIAQAFQKSLNLRLEPAGLSARELTRVDILVGDKYSHPSWTERV